LTLRLPTSSPGRPGAIVASQDVACFELYISTAASHPVAIHYNKVEGHYKMIVNTLQIIDRVPGHRILITLWQPASMFEDGSLAKIISTDDTDHNGQFNYYQIVVGFADGHSMGCHGVEIY